MKTKLEKIAKKYETVKFNNNNYAVGGGLSEDTKFASNRHQDAKYDNGKLTFGEATKIFKTATNLDIELVKSIIKFVVPNMEWHHAGTLPKSYGGGMKKTYFLKSTEIVDLATNWDVHFEKYSALIENEKNAAEVKKYLQERKLDFLKNNAKYLSRIKSEPPFFHRTEQEMQGKYGWFDSSSKFYNMPEYYSGWEFETKEKLNEFLRIE